VFFVIFGLLRGYGMHLSNALPLGYCLFYLSILAVSPNVFSNLAKIFPPANGILLLFFVISIFKVIMAYLRKSRQSTEKLAKELRKTPAVTADTDQEIDREMEEDKDNQMKIKRKTMRITKFELKTIEDIENYLEQMIKIIKEKETKIDAQEIQELSDALKHISTKERLLRRGIEVITKHVHTYQNENRKDVSELKKRLAQTKDPSKRKTIEKEIEYQKHMLRALRFLELHEKKIRNFCQNFNQLLSEAVQKIEAHYPVDALLPLEKAHRHLVQMKEIYAQQKDIEKYLLRLNKKTIKNLKKEKKK